MDSKTRNRILFELQNLKLMFDYDETLNGEKARKLINAAIADPENKELLNELDKLIKTYNKK